MNDDDRFRGQDPDGEHLADDPSAGVAEGSEMQQDQGGRVPRPGQDLNSVWGDSYSSGSGWDDAPSGAGGGRDRHPEADTAHDDDEFGDYADRLPDDETGW